MQTTEQPRTEVASRAGHILAIAFLAIIVLFVAGLAVLTLIALGRLALGG